MSDLPEDTAAPESEAVAPSADEAAVSGLGSEDPKARRAALDAMREAEEPMGPPVVDKAKAANAEANRQASVGERFDPKRHDGTVTYGKGVPHAKTE